jgi:predicted TIM-barrel fold metal-dependent hydrolase
MIVDIHAHAFPRLSEASGYDSPETHLKYIQRLASSSTHMRFEGELPGLDEDVWFKVGKYGKLEWVKGGRKCFLRQMPPTVVDMAWPPEHMLAHMDWMGIDKAILYQGHIYGRLNDYLADCVKKWPDRFAAVAQIDEARASEETQLSELRRSIKTLGLKAVYFEVPQRPSIDDEIFSPLWDEILNLKVPLVLELGRPSTAEQYLDVVSRTAVVMKKFPDVKAIIPVMGSNINDPKDPEYVDIPTKILNLITLPNVWYEVGYLLGFDKFDEYPYTLAQKMTREAYEAVGAENLVWGADMPMLMRTCTYRQAIDFVRRHCNFLSEAEKDLVLGENAAKLLGL